MDAALYLHYRDGYKIKPQWPALAGQLQSERIKNTEVLYLCPMDWSFSYVGATPLAVLWLPEFGRAAEGELHLKGLEATVKGRSRPWCIQTWTCTVMDGAVARTYLDDRKDKEPLKPAIFHPDQVSGIEVDNPFG